MPRDYWTCPNCGANLDHGEKCDCKEQENHIKKGLSIDDEIRQAKAEKALNKKTDKLMESLEVSDDESALLTLKYCETAEMLREFDYKGEIFKSLKESRDYRKINELNETVHCAKEKIYSTDINIVLEGYRDLAKVYISLR